MPSKRFKKYFKYSKTPLSTALNLISFRWKITVSIMCEKEKNHRKFWPSLSSRSRSIPVVSLRSYARSSQGLPATPASMISGHASPVAHLNWIYYFMFIRPLITGSPSNTGQHDVRPRHSSGTSKLNILFHVHTPAHHRVSQQHRPTWYQATPLQWHI